MDDDDVIEGQRGGGGGEREREEVPNTLGAKLRTRFLYKFGSCYNNNNNNNNNRIHKSECKSFEGEKMERYPHAIDSLHLFKTECLHSLSFGLVISYAHSTKLIV